VIEFVARQGHVPSEELGGSGVERSARGHRLQIRDSFRFRICMRTDEETLIGWLAVEGCSVDQRGNYLLSALASRYRYLKIEPPGRADGILGSAPGIIDMRLFSS
jgi:Domain of unknown function (DUF4158)